MSQPQEKEVNPETKKKETRLYPAHTNVWPPPPIRSEPEVVKAPPAKYLLTGINWLDAALGIPSGFIISFVLWGAAGIAVQTVIPPPSHEPQVLAIWVIGAVLTVATYLLVGRRYSLFAITMWVGGLPFLLFMLMLAFCTP